MYNYNMPKRSRAMPQSSHCRVQGRMADAFKYVGRPTSRGDDVMKLAASAADVHKSVRSILFLMLVVAVLSRHISMAHWSIPGTMYPKLGN